MRTDKEYEKKLHKILKTYNSILVKCKNIPLLADKNIIMVDNFGSMVNAQIETRKPILYYQEVKSISFIILDGREGYVFILKEDDAIVNEVEHAINNFEYARNTFVKDILATIEKALLSGNLENEKLLASSEIKYLGNKKENNAENNEVNNTVNNNNENQNTNSNNENINGTTNNMEGLYLVPIKNKKKAKKRRKVGIFGK